MGSLKAFGAWWGRKATFGLIALVGLLSVCLFASAEAAEAYGLWATGIYGVMAGANAAITIGSQRTPATPVPSDPPAG